MSRVTNIRRLVLIALFAALFIWFSAVRVNLGLSLVPFTLQVLGVVLAGVFLGAVDGFLSIFLVLALTAVGLPLLQGQGGWSLFIGATGGFLWMFPISALLTGLLGVKFLRSRMSTNPIIAFIVLFIIMELFGSFLVYVTGIPWLAHVAKLSFAKTMTLYCYPYLVVDALKNIVAALAAVALRRYLPSLRNNKS